MYVYEHINGSYHFVPDLSVRSMGEKMYFSSLSIKEFWHFMSDEAAKDFVKIKKES